MVRIKQISGSTVEKKTYSSDIKRFDGEHIDPASLKVVAQVIVRDHQHHLAGVTLLPIEFYKDLGIRASPVDAASLHRNVVTDVWTSNKENKPHPEHRTGNGM